MTAKLQTECVDHFDANRIRGIAAELARQQKARRDFVYPLSALSYQDDGRLVFQGHAKTFDVAGRAFVKWEDAEAYLDHSRATNVDGADDWTIAVGDASPAVPLNDNGLSQLLERVGVPGRFHNYLTGKGYSDVAGNLIRELIAKESKTKVLVRTLDGRARAVLSDRYRIIDSADLFFAAAEKFKELGAQIWTARLWDDGFQMFGVAPHIAGEVTTDRTFDPGDGWVSRWYGKAGDVHNAAVRIDNSETGNGGLNVRLSIMRRVCQNFCVWADGVSQVHVGKRLTADNGIILSDETRQLEGKVLWSTVKDAIATAFNETKFAELIARLNAATEDKIEKPAEAVENLCAAYDLSEERRAAILADLVGSGDQSRFGLIQSVTEVAHAVPAADAGQLELIGGELVSMSSGKFASLIGA